MEVYGIIYLLIDATNDKEYVGQTTRTVEERFKEHAGNKKSFIGRAIRAHGVDMFVIAILKVCYSKAELDRWERHMIRSRDTKSPNGYNLTEGGEGTLGLEFTPEHRTNIAATRKGKPLPPEHYIKLSILNKGKGNPFFGKSHTKEARKKMAVTHRKEIHYKNLVKELNAHEILYLELANLLGISVSCLSTKLSGRRRFSAKDIAKLVQIFGMPIEYLLQRDDGLAITTSNRGKTPYNNLLNELEKRKLTYTALVELLGISIPSLSMKMHGKQNFTARDKAKLVEIFDKPIEYLLERDG